MTQSVGVSSPSVVVVVCAPSRPAVTALSESASRPGRIGGSSRDCASPFPAASQRCQAAPPPLGRTASRRAVVACDKRSRRPPAHREGGVHAGDRAERPALTRQPASAARRARHRRQLRHRRRPVRHLIRLRKAASACCSGE